MIDFDKTNAFDVIDRSISMHPSLLVECIKSANNAHADYARRTYHADLRANCFRYIRENSDTIRAIEAGKSAAEACTTFHRVIETVNIACRLQIIPHHLRSAIVARHDLGHLDGCEAAKGLDI